MNKEEIVLKRLKDTLSVLTGKNVVTNLDFQIRNMVEDCIKVIEKQQAEIEDWKTDYNHRCQLAIDRKIELEKKDKIINEMALDIKEADKFLDSMGYLGEYVGYTIEDIIEEYKKEAEYKIKEDK